MPDFGPEPVSQHTRIASCRLARADQLVASRCPCKPVPYHLFWDDIDKLKMTDFKTEVLFDLVDSLYRQKHGLTVTSNYSMRDLVEHERMHPAIVRRLDDMCRVIEI